MFRRGFFGFVSGLFASAAVVKAAQVEESYRFDWSCWKDGQPFTDDPRWQGKLGWPDPSRIMLDGKDVSHRGVRRCKTGRNGWVDVLYREPRSALITNDSVGRFADSRFGHGHQVAEIGADGNLVEHRLFGNVEYVRQ